MNEQIVSGILSGNHVRTEVARDEENVYGKNMSHSVYLPPGVNPG
jgi:hypothetical protein